MGERQSASDELSTHGSQGGGSSSGDSHGPEPVADQVAATPSAADPAPVEPGDPAPGPEDTVATGGAPGTGLSATPVARAPGSGGWFRGIDEQPTQAMRAHTPAGPNGVHPNGVSPSGVHPSGVHPNGVHPNGVNPNGVHPDGDPDGGRSLFAPHTPAAEHPTVKLPAVIATVPPPPEPAGPAPSGESPRRRPLLIAAAVLGLLALFYVVDLVLSLGSVPRGVTVAGVSVGGLTYTDAERELRARIEPRTTRPVPVTVGQVGSEIDPRTAGLRIDWEATLDRAGSQPLNPFTRIASYFGAREVGVVTISDRDALIGTLEQLAPVVDRDAVEGSVAFDAGTPTPVDPVPGQRLEVVAAADVLEDRWTDGTPVALPLTELAPITSAQDVRTAIEKVARPAVSAPVTIIGEQDTRAVIEPATIAEALSFQAEPGGGLVPQLNQEVVETAVRPQLASTETPGRDATMSFASGVPVVTPSQDGRGVDYPATLKDLLNILTREGTREITAVYAEQPAELTTEDLRGLGVTGLISEFTTGGFRPDSGINIRRAAEQINGKIVEPGETFSLNAATLPRNAANGYVEAGIIDGGAPGRGIAGGTSQVATTLYNAAYFAGMVDVEHKEHSFYISRYPAGREATVVAGAIDLRFRNDNPTGVLIQTVWTPSTLTVRMFGTKRYEVTSTPGPRTNPTQPQTVTIPTGKPCSPSQGGPGFTITDTRTLRDVTTGQTRSETRTVRYNPAPIVVCEQ